MGLHPGHVRRQVDAGGRTEFRCLLEACAAIVAASAVYLSRLPAGLGWRDYGREYLNLGPLKGNIGSQNYTIPTEADLAGFRSVVIWCRRFAVGFGVAPLDRQ